MATQFLYWTDIDPNNETMPAQYFEKKKISNSSNAIRRIIDGIDGARFYIVIRNILTHLMSTVSFFLQLRNVLSLDVLATISIQFLFFKLKSKNFAANSSNSTQ